MQCMHEVDIKESFHSYTIINAYTCTFAHICTLTHIHTHMHIHSHSLIRHRSCFWGRWSDIRCTWPSHCSCLFLSCSSTGSSHTYTHTHTRMHARTPHTHTHTTHTCANINIYTHTYTVCTHTYHSYVYIMYRTLISSKCTIYADDYKHIIIGMSVLLVIYSYIVWYKHVCVKGSGDVVMKELYTIKAQDT